MPFANDNFANATVISGASGAISPFHYDGTTDPATAEASEIFIGNGETLWWKWVAPLTGTISFTTSGSTSDDASPNGLDTLLSLFSSFSNQLVSNDDGTDVLYPYNSRVSRAVTAGTTIWIQLDEYAGAVGTVHLSWAYLPPTITSVSSFYGTLSPDMIVPNGTDHYLNGTNLAGATTVTFSGGAVCAVTSATATYAHFTTPTDLTTIFTGPITVSTPFGTVTHEVVVLKPETTTYDRQDASYTKSGNISHNIFGTPRAGTFQVTGMGKNGTTIANALAAGVSTLDNARDGSYYNSATQVTFRAEQINVDIGTAQDTLAPPASGPVPAGQRLAQWATGLIESGRTPVVYLSLTLSTPVQSRVISGGIPLWSDTLAEVYAVPASELSEFDPSFPPYRGSVDDVNHQWPDPSYLAGLTPIATTTPGAPDSSGVGAVTALTSTVAGSQIWYSSSNKAFVMMYIVPRVFRTTPADENSGAAVSGTGLDTRFNSSPLDVSPSSNGQNSSNPLPLVLTIKPPAYRFWLPTPRVVTTGWTVGQIAIG